MGLGNSGESTTVNGRARPSAAAIASAGSQAITPPVSPELKERSAISLTATVINGNGKSSTKLYTPVRRQTISSLTSKTKAAAIPKIDRSKVRGVTLKLKMTNAHGDLA